MPSTDFTWSILEYFVPYVRKLHFIRLFLVHIPSFGSGRHNSGLRATQYGGKYDRRYLVFGEYNPDEDETKYVDYLHFQHFFIVCSNGCYGLSMKSLIQEMIIS